MLWFQSFFSFACFITPPFGEACRSFKSATNLLTLLWSCSNRRTSICIKRHKSTSIIWHRTPRRNHKPREVKIMASCVIKSYLLWDLKHCIVSLYFNFWCFFGLILYVDPFLHLKIPFERHTVTNIMDGVTMVTKSFLFLAPKCKIEQL